MKSRYAFVDWYRGLACVLMFQTHAYDSWTADAYRSNTFWWVSRHLGGFPSRLFLLLAGVSLMLRFDADRRKNVPIAVSRWGAAKRGFEVLGLGYLFRLTEWILGGAGWSFIGDIFKVDILNCIGVSLVIAAYIASPRDLEDKRIPWWPAVAALAIVFVTPILEALHWPQGSLRVFTSYVCGARPGWFPIFPWLSYVLVGCVAGAVWIRAQRAGKLDLVMGATLVVGIAMAFGGQIARRADMTFYAFGDNQAAPTSPTAFFYRSGMCLIGGVLSWLAVKWVNPERFSPMRQLGKTSLMVYWVHVEMVYGHLSDPIKHRLNLLWGSLLLGLLTAAMIALSVWRTEVWPKWRARAAASPAKTAG